MTKEDRYLTEILRKLRAEGITAENYNFEDACWALKDCVWGNKFITYLRINEMKIIMELSQIKELF